MKHFTGSHVSEDTKTLARYVINRNTASSKVKKTLYEAVPQPLVKARSHNTLLIVNRYEPVDLSGKRQQATYVTTCTVASRSALLIVNRQEPNEPVQKSDLPLYIASPWAATMKSLNPAYWIVSFTKFDVSRRRKLLLYDVSKLIEMFIETLTFL